MNNDFASRELIIEKTDSKEQRKNTILLSLCENHGKVLCIKFIAKLHKFPEHLFKACLHEPLFEGFIKRYGKNKPNVYSNSLDLIMDFIDNIPPNLLTIENFRKIICLTYFSYRYADNNQNPNTISYY